MATVQIELSTSNIWQAVQQLDASEFDSLFKDMIALRTQRLVPTIADAEAQILNAIYQSRLSESEQAQYATFSDKSEKEMLTGEEQRQFRQLIEKSERLNVERLHAVSKLAALRGESFDTIMQTLDLLNSDVITTLNS